MRDAGRGGTRDTGDAGGDRGHGEGRGRWGRAGGREEEGTQKDAEGRWDGDGLTWMCVEPC